MINEKYLPIGSVVLLKSAKKRVMIIGYLVQSKETGDKVFDYMACLFPEGVLSSEQNLVFNHEQIEKIFSLGYTDKEFEKVHVELKKIASEMSNNVTDVSRIE